MEVFVARQAIFDRTRNIYGYELLYRSSAVNRFENAEPTAATSQLLANCLLSIGLSNIVGPTQVFVNFGREMLLEEGYAALPKRSSVIEILETVEPDEEVVAACQKLRESGYRVALDDFVARPGYECLVELADLIKVEVASVPWEEQARMVKDYHRAGKRALAEKVETYEQFEKARAAGYDYFQGYFFARPVMLQARQVPATKMSCLRLLQEASQPELDLDRLHRLIAADVSFSYKLLRYVNSGLVGPRSEIRSLIQALVFIGADELRRWIALAALPVLADDKPAELVMHSLTRARMCQTLAKSTASRASEPAFLMGMFSLLDALMDRPLEQTLEEINLDAHLRTVLAGSAAADDTLGRTYRLVLSYELGDWDAVEELCRSLRIPESRVSDSYCEAVSWAADGLNPRVAA